MNKKTMRYENGVPSANTADVDKNIMTHNLGFPRIGERRELKRATEAFWNGSLSLDELKSAGAELRRQHWLLQKQSGIDLIPSNDFSFYDQMLDMSCLLGNIPARFAWDGAAVDLPLLFQIARGSGGAGCACGAHTPAVASEMTKWFDTNYHYIVPEFHRATTFQLGAMKPFDEFSEALALGFRTKPVLIGPLTYLYLGKSHEVGFDRLSLLDRLLPVYEEILRRLAGLGAEWVQIDEPVLALDLAADWQAAFPAAFQALRGAAPSLKLMLATYFGELRDNAALAFRLPVDALHIDLTRGGSEFDSILDRVPENITLSLGVVDGRNIWKNDFELSCAFLEKARQKLGAARMMVAPSCSLLHCPVSLRNEESMDAEIREWLAFAEEKLSEVTELSQLACGNGNAMALHDNQVAIRSRLGSARVHRPEVKRRSSAVTPDDSRRASSYSVRREKQRSALRLPLFPTTTIGSFPQTSEVRSVRRRFKKGDVSEADYISFLKEKTAECVRFQEEVGLDVLVHGEFERNDMVEYFGESLDGFLFTANGWVQSYGSRCVKPPVIFGDVQRPRAMTVDWSTYAQSLTERPMKGMLTGPITILQWSFVRDDQPRRETARQIALAIRDEVQDLERAGIRIIQIDEPALREGLPLRRSDWAVYLDWSSEAFRISASGVRDETQIHTHMCYCEFNDIIDTIAALDADVISIETSRSSMELLGAFVTFDYPNEIGPGVWDIHSPRVPSAEEMRSLLRKAVAVLPVDKLWVNPDCGLKTRGWPEVTIALGHMIAAARALRAEFRESVYA
ncbi:5-methyltetrahydropteroyltriglutamate--homocysteine methyltransferase [Terrimicrobium sacchariphilum]|uniref:5-methyltetrahydropteroyltriglutamate--homocysteine methyltransferase n=2 Tax=Terrimicrobium sacchariphilum TaxID=690879 RepID=A0A146G9M7_TERSA|nr:5-methyltetrahydropteroyltriglutamate--homocysteine methyltransferase [Terrimicrobium sacchariphilum]